ncbi:unnamed protein product [Leptosia nina]|uniref:Uncharacterized protein n=1 Tax=Leptosia nina TaxID=320188 RepID=A0AAV1JGF6_9NEOP
MACKASFNLYHNFPKLAEEAGFTFNIHRPRVQIEWNKIRLIDVESLVRERKFVIIEQHINDILDCVLESEFDVRILDAGFVKLYRLAQLAVEYQQFCRHYLDRSVFVLREEISSLAKELETTKRELREKEDELRRLRKKSRQVIRTPLPYGNENIATMILNTLKNQTNLFPTAPHLDTLEHNKRHPNVTEIPQKDSNTEENSKLYHEIENLKGKLKEMENVISQPNESKSNFIEANTSKNDNRSSEVINIQSKTETKDAEVLTQENGLHQIEEWRKHEFDNYNKELNVLKSQINHLLDAEKDKKTENTKSKDDFEFINKLQMTIKQQGDELSSLKQELLNSKCIAESKETETKKEFEVQMARWTRKVEDQSNECKILLQKLNETAKEVHQYKELAEAERGKVLELQKVIQSQKELENVTKPEQINHVHHKGPHQMPDRLTLEKLQKQAEDLLKLEQSTSDISSSSEPSRNMYKEKNKVVTIQKNVEKSKIDTTHPLYKKKPFLKANPGKQHKVNYTKKLKKKEKEQKNNCVSKNKHGSNIFPVSPVKVVRAKVTEAVNQCLTELGVDPLKNRLPKTVFQNQRAVLQEKREVKVKKYPSREIIYHSILTHLDKNATVPQKSVSQDTFLSQPSPGKSNKAYRFSSVISNVKTKALSLVKSNEKLKNKNEKITNFVADKTLTVHNGSPASLEYSPKIDKKSKVRSKDETVTADDETYLKRHTNLAHSTHNNSETSDDSVSQDNAPIKYARESKPNGNQPITLTRSQTKPKSELDNHNEKENDIASFKRDINAKLKRDPTVKDQNSLSKYNLSSDDMELLDDSKGSISLRQTRGVLRNASSTPSLNKKKVLFDMDAIQMKSISASPSQSLGEKNSEKYTLGIINLDAEDTDLSSVEREEVINTKIRVSSRVTPKIEELKQAIESQMAHRIKSPSTALAGSINVLPIPTPMVRTSLGGSNTSLGSSILDDSENLPVTNRKGLRKEEKTDENEIDISDFLADDKSDSKF